MRWFPPAVFGFLLLSAPFMAAAGPVNFSRDILPILSDNCLSCHGPDESHRKAGLRLDLREGALAKNDDGLAAIVPGDPEQSELMVRILSTDPDEVMPTPKSHKPRLSDQQAATFRQWIKEGAVWGKHWAFEKPARAEPPAGGGHPLDRFIRARLHSEGLSAAPRAARHTLLRRASFDLTGLPPSTADLAAFLADESPEAWERVVQRLLASPHFGERLAMWWLDAARYADTDGFQLDDTRTNWPWRDWVVAAFNANQPFDQFTIDQFAGDLLPDATPEQTLATCFHRNHMTNGEGGRDPEESRVDYVRDRVNTVGAVWMGITLTCAQCHTHKFDPVTHADYYKMTAFFNSIDENGKAGKGAKPYLAYQSPLAKRAVAEAEQLLSARKPAEETARRAAEAPFAAWLEKAVASVRGGFTAWHPLRGSVVSLEGTELTQEADGTVQSSGPHPNQDDYQLLGPVQLSRVTGLRLEVLPHVSHTEGGLSRGQSGEFILTDIKVRVRRHGSAQIREILLASAAADFSADKKANNGYGDIKDVLDDDGRNGWTTKGAPKTEPHVAVFAFDEPYVPQPDEELVIELRQRSTLGDANIGRFRVSLTDQAGETVRQPGASPLEELAAAQLSDASLVPGPLRERLLEQFLEDHGPYRAPRAALDRASRQLDEVKKAAGKLDVMVLAERSQPRESFVLLRGEWDKHGEKVAPGVPDAIAPWSPEEKPDRLGLARWLVSRENPLTARVIVNHFWQMLFGAGLVRTPEDFGLQGERPTHPELLDWLAVEFMESGWDVKRLLHLIVTSETYCQDSACSAELLARDLQNRLLARGARFRLPSWMLRDAALATSGLLNAAVGGPPVRPYQPEGVWEEIFMGRFKYQPSEGAAQYRRTLYAFWRRSIAPTFLFDSAQRRVCEVAASRTNTPLQALTLLNDETGLEAAQALAIGMLSSGGHDPASRVQWLLRSALSRDGSESEVAILLRELTRAQSFYHQHPEEAARFLRRGQSAPDARYAPAEIAAHCLVASLVLNLDEAITHE